MPIGYDPFDLPNLPPAQWLSTAQSLSQEAQAALYQSQTQEYLASLAKLQEDKELSMIIEAKPGFTFGCDPEVFVKDDKGRYVSAEGLIPGDKANPHKVEFGAVQVDGMAAEFNIDPVTTFAEFNRNIEKVYKQLADFLPKGYTLDAVPSVVFDEDVFNASPDKAKELGCMPDFNAWTGVPNPPPSCPDNPFLRTASGHLHLGWTDEQDGSDAQHLMNCRDIVKQLDWYLGAWSVKMDPDATRRKLYGKAGACRIKPYGVEYRVLSNFWITTRDRRLHIWNRMQQAIHDMRHCVFAELSEHDNADIIRVINKSERNMLLEQQHNYPLRTISADDGSFRRTKKSAVQPYPYMSATSDNL